MKFYSKRYRVTLIPKKTKALGFDKIKIGDHIKCTIRLKETRGASSGGLYALYIQTMHEERGASWDNSQNQFINNISKFGLTEDPLHVE